MDAQIIDGRALAARLREDVHARATALRARGVVPRLDALIVDAGDNSSRVYAQNQHTTCAAEGIEYNLHELLAGTTQQEIIDAIERLDADDAVQSVMMHLPLPAGMDEYAVKEHIRPDKDVEGVTAANMGDVVFGRSMQAPCTALATLKMIESVGCEVRGKRAVIVGAGAIVGRPIAVLLMQREATVVSCNEYTRGLDELCRSADILIPAAGVAGLITGKMVKPGALVVDVAVSRVKGADGRSRSVGDCVFDEVSEVAGWVSPVPGGVGPVTVAVLLDNVVSAAERLGGTGGTGVPPVN